MLGPRGCPLPGGWQHLPQASLLAGWPWLPAQHHGHALGDSLAPQPAQFPLGNFTPAPGIGGLCPCPREGSLAQHSPVGAAARLLVIWAVLAHLAWPSLLASQHHAPRPQRQPLPWCGQEASTSIWAEGSLLEARGCSVLEASAGPPRVTQPQQRRRPAGAPKAASETPEPTNAP